jgi:choline dehydrogenase-like flavoprotein
MWHLFRRFVLLAQEHYVPWRAVQRVSRGGFGLYTVMRAEQSPNPDSRITLGTERDRLGTPKPKLHWQFQSIDKYSVAATMRALGSELERLGLGRVKLADWLCDSGQSWQVDPLVSSHPVGGYHHMGTTRMGATPATGVVDANCRVFGVQNLYVAGSSVFTTAGWANPTLTLLALSLRLADHLTMQLQSRKL